MQKRTDTSICYLYIQGYITHLDKCNGIWNLSFVQCTFCPVQFKAYPHMMEHKKRSHMTQNGVINMGTFQPIKSEELHDMPANASNKSMVS